MTNKFEMTKGTAECLAVALLQYCSFMITPLKNTVLMVTAIEEVRRIKKLDTDPAQAAVEVCFWPGNNKAYRLFITVEMKFIPAFVDEPEEWRLVKVAFAAPVTGSRQLIHREYNEPLGRLSGAPDSWQWDEGLQKYWQTIYPD